MVFYRRASILLERIIQRNATALPGAKRKRSLLCGMAIPTWRVWLVPRWTRACCLYVCFSCLAQRKAVIYLCGIAVLS